MKDKQSPDYINELINRYDKLAECRQAISDAAELLVTTAAADGKILICGNGGSSADADHIVGELMKGFLLQRRLPDKDRNRLFEAGGELGRELGTGLQRGIQAVSLSAQTALSTAFMNDVEPSFVFAQQVWALGRPGDLFWGLSTSGNSRNVAAAAIAAKAAGMKTLAMTGAESSRLSEICDVTIKVPETETYKVQELHLPIYHCLCIIAEAALFA